VMVFFGQSKKQHYTGPESGRSVPVLCPCRWYLSCQEDNVTLRWPWDGRHLTYPPDGRIWHDLIWHEHSDDFATFDDK